MLQLKKIPDIPVSTREEARESHPHPEEPRFRLLAREEGSFPCVVRKEFPAFPSHLKRFPDIPVSSREEARVSHPHPEEPHFRLLPREEGRFSCVVGKEFPVFPSHLKMRRSPQERREELQGRATIPRVPQMYQSIPGKPVFPALPGLSSPGSTHTTVARGTAL